MTINANMGKPNIQDTIGITIDSGETVKRTINKNKKKNYIKFKML